MTDKRIQTTKRYYIFESGRIYSRNKKRFISHEQFIKQTRRPLKGEPAKINRKRDKIKSKTKKKQLKEEVEIKRKPLYKTYKDYTDRGLSVPMVPKVRVKKVGEDQNGLPIYQNTKTGEVLSNRDRSALLVEFRARRYLQTSRIQKSIKTTSERYGISIEEAEDRFKSYILTRARYGDAVDWDDIMYP